MDESGVFLPCLLFFTFEKGVITILQYPKRYCFVYGQTGMPALPVSFAP